MKRNVLFSAALAGLMLASCASSDELGAEGTGFNETGKGYVNITLNLPTQKGGVTRANDKTDDGTANEYKVNDAALLIFAGISEADAEFKAAYNLENFKVQDVEANKQISTQFSKVQEINAVSGEGNIYAYVVVNKGTSMTVETDHTLKINGTPFTGKFSAFSTTNISGELTENNLMMTNTPVVTMPGSAEFDNATTLTDVTASIFKTEAEATANPAADIFVERLAAKVSLKQSGYGTSTATISTNGETAEAFSYSLEKWGLANVNGASYLTRQYSDDWKKLASDGTDFADGADKTAWTANKYRFAGINLIKTKSNDNPKSNKYRTYWGQDANYSADAPFSDSQYDMTDAKLTLSKDGSTYCYENTFDVKHQDVRNTTCAIVKMKITPKGYTVKDGTFYTINGGKEVIYDLANAKIKVGNQFLAGHNQKDLKTTYFPAITGDGTITVTGVEFSDKAGAVKFSKLTLTFTPASGTATTADVTDDATLTALANNIKVVKYEGGYSYYTVLIKHFGDDLTPWNASTKTTVSYPEDTAEKNWLGRYGVLRNNWYELDITGVGAIGAATPEELDVNHDSTPDDNLKSYISARINVLSWAKRTQSTILQ